MVNKKIHTTDYFNTLIEVAEDCPVLKGKIPVMKGDKPTVATIQYERISRQPYKWTSDDLLFQIYADKNELTSSEYPEARALFFSKGQPCLRTSPLAKRYGFGIHFDEAGKMAVYGLETEAYHNLLADPAIKKVKAMRSSKK